MARSNGNLSIAKSLFREIEKAKKSGGTGTDFTIDSDESIELSGGKLKVKSTHAIPTQSQISDIANTKAAVNHETTGLATKQKAFTIASGIGLEIDSTDTFKLSSTYAITTNDQISDIANTKAAVNHETTGLATKQPKLTNTSNNNGAGIAISSSGVISTALASSNPGLQHEDNLLNVKPMAQGGLENTANGLGFNPALLNKQYTTHLGAYIDEGLFLYGLKIATHLGSSAARIPGISGNDSLEGMLFAFNSFGSVDTHHTTPSWNTNAFTMGGVQQGGLRIHNNWDSSNGNIIEVLNIKTGAANLHLKLPINGFAYMYGLIDLEGASGYPANQKHNATTNGPSAGHRCSFIRIFAKFDNHIEMLVNGRRVGCDANSSFTSTGRYRMVAVTGRYLFWEVYWTDEDSVNSQFVDLHFALMAVV